MRFLLLVFLLSSSVWGHQSSMTSSGKKLKWQNKNQNIVINTNTSDLSATTTRNIILNSIAEWNSVTSANLSSANSSSNQVIFDTNFSRYGSSVIGVTEISSNSGGDILDATIRLNDNYTFKDTPGNYSSGSIYLGDVVTHEVGHFFGLAHSEVLNSTMFYSNFPGQATLAYDDKSGVRQIYDSSYGRIFGWVKGGSNIGVLGTQVQLISVKTGDTVAGVTDQNGYFDISGLDPNDTFYIYTSVVKKLQSLPGSFANVQSGFCPASYVGGFYNACGVEHDGNPQGITLTSSAKTVNAGVISINCSLRSDADYNFEKIQTSFGAPVSVFNYAREPRTQKSFVGYFLTPSSTLWSTQDALEIDLRNYTSTSGTSKYLKVKLVSQPFGNQLEYQMDFIQNGVALPAFHQGISYSGVYQTYSTDMEAILPLSGTASNNIFDVSLKSRKLSNFYIAQTFPSSDVFSTGSQLPYLLVMGIWEDIGGVLTPVLETTSNLSDNSICLDAPFTYAVASATVYGGDDSKSNAPSAGCGTIDTGDKGDGGGGTTALLTLGFMCSFLFAAFIKKTKNFLS
jgi:predicted Zn-dependent protease